MEREIEELSRVIDSKIRLIVRQIIKLFRK